MDIPNNSLAARYDAACKRVLSQKVILARIMQACLEEYSAYDPDEIAEKFIEGQPLINEASLEPIIQGLTNTDEAVSFDILFHSLAPADDGYIRLIINLEAQNAWDPGYSLMRRGVYYCSRLLADQYGKEFSHSQYDNLKKVYSVWICMQPPDDYQNTINRYKINEEHILGDVKEPRQNYDLLSLVRICLGRESGKNYCGIVKLLSVLFSKQKNKFEKEKILQEDFNIVLTQTLDEEVSAMCNLSRDVWNDGVKEGTLLAVKNLMESTKWSPEQAMEMLKIPKEEWPKFRKMLN